MSVSNRERTLAKLSVVGVLMAASGVSAQSQDLALVYEKDGVNLRKYTQLLIKPLNLGDTRLVPPPWVGDPDPKVWSLSEENVDLLRTTFASSMRAGIEEDSRYQVVAAPTPWTLQLEVHLVSLTPWAARGEQVETLGSGSLTFEVHVRDAQTADLLAVFEGTQLVGTDYQENTAFNHASNLTEHFTTWGRDVSRRLAARQTQ